MVRPVAAAFLALHALAHLLGFASAWRLAEYSDIPFTTWVANGTVDLGVET